MTKKIEYRPYDTVKIRAVDLPEVNGKIKLPDVFRGKEATVVSVSEFPTLGEGVDKIFLDTIFIEVLTGNHTSDLRWLLAVEPQHIRLLKRAPRAFKDIEKCAK